jgi:hypothetical protein
MSRRQRQLAALAPIAMVALISACGSSAPATAAGSSGGAGSTAARAKAVKFAECIRSNGVTAFPDPDAVGQFAYGIPSYSSPFRRRSGLRPRLQWRSSRRPWG